MISFVEYGAPAQSPGRAAHERARPARPPRDHFEAQGTPGLESRKGPLLRRKGEIEYTTRLTSQWSLLKTFDLLCRIIWLTVSLNESQIVKFPIMQWGIGPDREYCLFVKMHIGALEHQPA